MRGGGEGVLLKNKTREIGPVHLVAKISKLASAAVPTSPGTPNNCSQSNSPQRSRLWKHSLSSSPQETPAHFANWLMARMSDFQTSPKERF